MSTSVLYTGTDMILSLAGLVDDAGDPITNATVELTELEDCDGVTPDGITLPLALNHVDAGTYEGQIEDSIEVTVGQVFTGKIEVTSTAGDSSWYETIVVRRRSA